MNHEKYQRFEVGDEVRYDNEDAVVTEVHLDSFRDNGEPIYGYVLEGVDKGGEPFNVLAFEDEINLASYAINYWIQRENGIRRSKGQPTLNRDERSAVRRILKGLLKKAKPNNWAQQILENKYGLDGDVATYDYGPTNSQEV